MRECSILVGKTKRESELICLNCPFPSCYLISGRRYRLKPCRYCDGVLYFNSVYEQWGCRRCSRAQVPQFEEEASSKVKANAETQTNDAKEEKQAPAPAPVPAELKRTVPYHLSSTLNTNGAWYPMGQINFCREHMIFLIKSLPLLQEGIFPRNPIGSDSGYTDAPIKLRKRGRHHAYYERPVQLAAEVETRLEACGQDGLILEAIYCWGKRPEYLMRAFKCDEEQLIKRVNSALSYISGWKRKERSYRDFVRHKKSSPVTH